MDLICVLFHGLRRELVRLEGLPVLLIHHRLTILILIVISTASALYDHVILHAVDFVSLQRVVFDLSFIIVHIDHLIATIFDVVFFVVIVWHHVLEILVRICVHILFFSLIKVLLELYIDSLVAFQCFYFCVASVTLSAKLTLFKIIVSRMLNCLILTYLLYSNLQI